MAKGPERECDYDETFSPVVRFASIRILLAHPNLDILEMKVNTAFPNGELHEVL